MSSEADVTAAAAARADALQYGDREQLADLLRSHFVWTSHKGDVFDRDMYLASNAGGSNSWHGQQLEAIDVRVVGDAAVLTCLVTDDVTTDTRGSWPVHDADDPDMGARARELALPRGPRWSEDRRTLVLLGEPSGRAVGPTAQGPTGQASQT